MTQVTYVPQENGDPITTAFGGFAFKANDPVDIPDDAKVPQIVVAETGKNSDGEPRTKGVEKMVLVVDVLKNNPYFRVAGHEPPAAVKKGGRPRLPKTAEEYKGFAMDWFSRAEDHKALAQRWEDEAPMREKLSVHDGGEIVIYLNKFYEARHHELRKAAG